MTPDYTRPAFVASLFKAPRGAAVLKKEQDDKHETDAEIAIKRDVKARDGKCRWPERHKCRFGMEVIHVQDRSTGGEFVTSNLWLGCGWIHRRGSKTIHSKDLEIRPLTKKGTDGLCSFWRWKDYETRKDGRWEHVATEIAIGKVAPQ